MENRIFSDGFEPNFNQIEPYFNELCQRCKFAIFVLIKIFKISEICEEGGLKNVSEAILL